MSQPPAQLLACRMPCADGPVQLTATTRVACFQCRPNGNGHFSINPKAGRAVFSLGLACPSPAENHPRTGSFPAARPLVRSCLPAERGEFPTGRNGPHRAPLSPNPHPSFPLLVTTKKRGLRAKLGSETLGVPLMACVCACVACGFSQQADEDPFLGAKERVSSPVAWRSGGGLGICERGMTVGRSVSGWRGHVSGREKSDSLCTVGSIFSFSLFPGPGHIGQGGMMH
ncbi:hypothetical protein VTI74DRAFT_548 [Chaetomium olivicolor]